MGKKKAKETTYDHGPSPQRITAEENFVFEAVAVADNPEAGRLRFRMQAAHLNDVQIRTEQFSNLGTYNLEELYQAVKQLRRMQKMAAELRAERFFSALGRDEDAS